MFQCYKQNKYSDNVYAIVCQGVQMRFIYMIVLC